LFAAAQQTLKPAAKAPVPIQIPSAHRVFLANGGSDAMELAAFKRDGDRDEPYNWLYAARKSWGRYQLVSTPAEADLVMEVSFTAPLSNVGNAPSYEPQMAVTIFDAKTHFKLWVITEETEGAIRKATWEKNFSETIANVIDDMKPLAGTGNP
jgi:hypothetical protein